MSNSIVTILKNHELRIKALEGNESTTTNNEGETNTKNVNTNLSKEEYTQHRNKYNEEIEKMKEETLYLKDTIHNIMKDYNRLKDLYISHNIEFLRFKQQVLDGNPNREEVARNDEEVAIQIKEKEPEQPEEQEHEEEQQQEEQEEKE